MDKKQAKAQIKECLKTMGIQYTFLLNEEAKVQDIKVFDTFYFSAEVPKVIGGHIETCLRFREEHVYCQTYYCQTIVKDEEEIFRASRMINYINTHLFYEADNLYEHTLALDEEEGDIYMGTLIRYEVLQEYFQETMSYVLDFNVQFLSDICAPLVLYIGKYISFFEAANELMGKYD